MEENNIKISKNFNEYIKQIEKCNRTSPFESSYQRIIENLLNDIIVDDEVELIVSAEFPRYNTNVHRVTQYKFEGNASPDLLLAKNFCYYNADSKGVLKVENKSVEVRAFIEVKAAGKIKIKKNDVYIDTLDKEQLATYLEYQNCEKLIFTDGYIWIFYENCNSVEYFSKIFVLYSDNEWKNEVDWYDFIDYLKYFVNLS